MSNIYVCSKCDARIQEDFARPQQGDELLAKMQDFAPEIFPPLIGPRQLYHITRGYHYYGAPGHYGGAVPFSLECGPLYPETDQDRYAETATDRRV